MIYAAVIVCHLGSCAALTDDFSPHDTQAACRARVAEMQAAAALALAHLPGLRMRGICAPLHELRQVIPDAFPDHQPEFDA